MLKQAARFIGIGAALAVVALVTGVSVSTTMSGTQATPAVTAIAAGYEHSLALKSDGTVWAWGLNNFGQLGMGSDRGPENCTQNGKIFPCSLTPLPVSEVFGSSVTAIAAGDAHSLALKSDGRVWAWGHNNSGALGDGTNAIDSPVPVSVLGLGNVTAITGGGGHSLALKSDGTVWAWGWNAYGQLGDGTVTDRYTPVQVSGL